MIVRMTQVGENLVNRYDVDVLVVGGGMAGVMAAVASARNGVNTMLVESQGSLGGLFTSGFNSFFVGEVEGLAKEFIDRMGSRPEIPSFALLPQYRFDPEKAKFVLEQMVLESGAKLLYFTRAIDAVVENNCIREVIVHNQCGKMSIAAKIFVDATGDVSVAAMAGAPCESGGREFCGLNMSSTLMFRLSHVNLRKYREAQEAWRSKYKEEMPKAGFVAELQEEAIQKGDLPYYIFPGPLINPIPGFPEEDCDVTIDMAHSYYCRYLDAEDLTRQLVEQRQQIIYLEKFFQKYVPGFENCRISGIASYPKLRETRRIIGEYILTGEDVVLARKFEDGIARVPAIIDIHHPTNPRVGFIRHIHLNEPKEPAVCRPAQCTADIHRICKPGGYEAWPKPGTYYEVPYRCLIPLKIDNLLVAGKGISTDFSTSCMGYPPHGIGQAAGTAAALCIKNGATPRKLDGKLVRKTLIEQGVPLDKEPTYLSQIKEKLTGNYIIVGDSVLIIAPKGSIIPV